MIQFIINRYDKVKRNGIGFGKVGGNNGIKKGG